MKLTIGPKIKKMKISEDKTKCLIFNFTKKFQFTTRLQLNNKNIQVVNKMQILGCTITDDLSWDENCSIIIKKVNARMQLIRRVWSFGATLDEMVHLWKVYCRSILEYSCVVWNSSLTQNNIEDLERTQKVFCKWALGTKYQSYEKAILFLNLDTLTERRRKLNLKWAQQTIMHNTTRDLFPTNNKQHIMHTRISEKYKVIQANTERLKLSSVVTMQNQLNEENRKQLLMK